MDVGAPENLVGEEVSQASDELLVDQRRFDLPAQPAEGAGELVARDVQSVGTHPGQSAVEAVIVRDQPDALEFAHVAVVQLAVVQAQDDPVVPVPVFGPRQRAGHAEVEEHRRSVLGWRQEPFTVPAWCGEPFATQRRAQASRADAVQHAGVRDLDVLDAVRHRMTDEHAAEALYIGKFRHAGRVPAGEPGDTGFPEFVAGYAGSMARDDRLGEYRAKRDVRRSGEPAAHRGKKGQRFVVQRHDASTLHFDFRLQVADVLVSWSVPKGPSLDPKDKRMAVRTEDHPLDYAEFEGEIPSGEYGAGTVVVWDIGNYRNLTVHDGEQVPMSQAVEAGHLVVWLDGDKLTGAYALTKAKLAGGEQWLLVKKDDEGADRRRKPAKTQPESVLTGRTNEDLASE